MLKIHEITLAAGLSAVFLQFEDGVLALVEPEGSLALPDGALASVMSRLGHVRHLARYDVIARDYLVDHSGDEEPLCALATTVAAALGYLGRAADGRQPTGTARADSSANTEKQH